MLIPWYNPSSALCAILATHLITRISKSFVIFFQACSSNMKITTQLPSKWSTTKSSDFNTLCKGYTNDLTVASMDFDDIFLSRFELQYFLYSSTLPETRAKHMTEFLQHYFTTTCSSLKKFGVDLLTEGYTFESFYQDFRKYSGWGMIAGLMITAGILDTRGVDMLHSMNEEAKTAGNIV